MGEKWGLIQALDGGQSPPMPPPGAECPPDLAAADSLQRAHVILRVAGPLPDPQAPADRLPWMVWLNGESARREGRRVATAHRLATRSHYREIPAMDKVDTAETVPAVDRSLLLAWLAATPHPRPLARWVAMARDGRLQPADETVVAVAMAAFSFPRHEAVNFWFYLRWRAGWQTQTWPNPRDFLVISGPVLPALRRRILRKPSRFATTGERNRESAGGLS